MVEDRKILHIADTISSIDNGQLGYELIVDADLLFKMWGGKDADGNVTKWLAKDNPIQVTTATLTGGTTTGSDGLVRHDTNGLLSGGLILISDLNDLISDADLASILDDAYNNDTGERTVIVDDGDVKWDLVGAYSFNIDLTNTTGGLDGFVVSDTFAEHWQLLRVADAGIDLEAALRNITYAASEAVILSAGATDDLSFRAREGTVTLNEVGETTLDTTSQSLVGAINELFALDHVITLDDAYNNDAGAAAVTVDAGDVSWDLTGAYSFNLNLENATGTSDGFWINTGTGEDKDFFNILKVDTDKLNLNALLEEVVIETAGGVAYECAGAFDLNCSNIDLSASTLTIKGTTKITTEAAEDLNLVPGAGGITVIGDAGAPAYLGTPTNDDAFIAGRAEIAGAIHINGIHIRELPGTASMLIAEGSEPVSSTGSYCSFIGYKSGSVHTSGLANTCVGVFTGEDLTIASYNTCLGHTAGRDIIDGSSNTLIGYETGNAVTSGIRNVAVGAELLGGATSSYNIVLGYRSARNLTSGQSNILMGYDVGEALTAEQNNICIGEQSGKNLTGSNNVFLGITAGRDVTTGAANVFLGYEAGQLLTNVSNTLLIGNSSASSLIYGKFDDANVGIGTTDLDGTPAVGRLTLKGSTNDGTTNVLVCRDSDEANVLLIDTNGVLFTSETTTPTPVANSGAWYTKTDNKPYFQDGAGVEHEIAINGAVQPLVAFYATRTSGSQALTTGVEAIIVLPNEDYDDGSDFNVSTYKFTAPTDGYYSFSASADITTGIAGRAELRLYKNTTIIAKGDAGHQTAATIIPCVSCQIKLAATDTVEVRAYQATGFAATLQNVDLHFSGVQIGEI